MVILMVALVGLRYEKRPAIRMVVTGFVTNRYVQFSGDYCAMVSVSNMGGGLYYSQDMFSGPTPPSLLGWGARSGPGGHEGPLGAGMLQPRSEITALVPVDRRAAIQITAGFWRLEQDERRFQGWLRPIRNFLGRFFRSVPKNQFYRATTAPFSGTNPVPFELKLRWEAIQPE